MGRRQHLTEVIEKEQSALDELISLLDEGTERAIDLISQCQGKVIFVAIGKSGHIGEKLAATFSSTGTPSFFVHCAECFHGDFGMIEQRDVVVLISNSGTTAEVVRCAPIIRGFGCKMIAFTRNPQSPLALECDCVCLLPTCAEADDLNLAPTVSSTATLVLGDAIACTVSRIRGFTRDDFHKYHPGGALGAKLNKEKQDG